MEKGEHSQHCRNVYVSLNLSKYAHAVSDDTLKDIAEKAINQNNVGELNRRHKRQLFGKYTHVFKNV